MGHKQQHIGGSLGQPGESSIGQLNTALYGVLSGMFRLLNALLHRVFLQSRRPTWLSKLKTLFLAGQCSKLTGITEISIVALYEKPDVLDIGCGGSLAGSVRSDDTRYGP